MGFVNLCTGLVGPTHSVCVIHLSTRVDAKTSWFWGRPQNEPFAPDFLVHNAG